MKISKIKSSFVGQITDINLKKKLTKPEIQSIKNALSQFGVIVIRKQEMTAKEYVRFSKIFGDAEYFPSHPSFAKVPEIFPVSNFPEGGFIYEGQNWHTDSIDDQNPAPMTLFYSHLLPAKGGDTLFINNKTLYDELSPRMKAQLEKLEVVYRTGTIHPMIKIHPATQESCLFLHFGLSYAVKGMDIKKGQALIKRLHQKYLKCEHIYRHHYRPGDLVIWDNIKSSHKAGGTDPKYKRIMLRITISGD
jgi:taurine dioxygenase